MSCEGLALLAVATQILRLTDYQDVLLEIESAVLNKEAELDGFQTICILYSFSKVLQGQAFGSDQFYVALARQQRKFWGQWSDRDKARAFFAFSNRSAIPPGSLEELYLPWIRERAALFGFAELRNVVFALMYNGVAEKEIWKTIMQSVSKQTLVVPISNFLALKLARYYMNALFPK